MWPLVLMLLQVAPVARERGGFNLRARALHVYEEALRVRRFSKLCYGVGLRTGSIGSNLEADVDEQVFPPLFLLLPLSLSGLHVLFPAKPLHHAHPTTEKCVAARAASRTCMTPGA